VGKPYQQELALLPKTFQWVERQDVSQLAHFLTRWKGEHVVFVGSGGSYSAAAIGSLFRELAHHSVSTAASPHEFTGISKRLAPLCLLLSAEGKNRDILQAAHTAGAADISAAAITLTLDNPLVALAARANTPRVFAYQMDWIKDGYLATNSLLAMVLLLFRAFFGDSEFQVLSSRLSEEYLNQRRLALQKLQGFAEIRQRGLLLLYSSQAQSFAVDLESKLSEAALATVQTADLRQFAHGRHLQLADKKTAPSVLIAYSTAEHALAEATRAQIPDGVAVEMVAIEGTTDREVAVWGLIDAMLVVEVLALAAGVDPGAPDVPMFGRNIHALDPSQLSPIGMAESCRLTIAARRKSGARIQRQPLPKVVDAAQAYVDRLTHANFLGLVTDFDGTLCRTECRFDDMDRQIVDELSSLIRRGFKVAIATGRGDSLHKILRKAFDEELHRAILVGYYSGSYIASLDNTFVEPIANEGFAKLWDWLRETACELPESEWRELARGGQFSLRLSSAQSCKSLASLVRVWIDQNELKDWRVFCSGHSVDVLDHRTSKRNVVHSFANAHSIDPITEILRVGDCGQEGGNDFELLSEGMSLSCAEVSTALKSCWNFGALGNSQSDVTLSYLRALVQKGQGFKLLMSAILDTSSCEDAK
jgi:fructoselysine-6-P-deglycase FrlB-like protein